jgi:hypothetical protein
VDHSEHDLAASVNRTAVKVASEMLDMLERYGGKFTHKTSGGVVVVAEAGASETGGPTVRVWTPKLLP